MPDVGKRRAKLKHQLSSLLTACAYRNQEQRRSELPTALFLGADYPARLTEGQGDMEQDPVVLGPLRVLPAPGTSTLLMVEA